MFLKLMIIIFVMNRELCQFLGSPAWYNSIICVERRSKIVYPVHNQPRNEQWISFWKEKVSFHMVHPPSTNNLEDT